MIQVLHRLFDPDFEGVCKQCGTSPTVSINNEVHGSVCVETELCGPCYFEDRQMLDYWLWNEFDDTYIKTEDEDNDD